MGSKVAGVHFTMTADGAKLLRELEKSRKAVGRFAKDARRGMNRAQYAFNRMRRVAQLFASAFILVAAVKRIGQFATSTEKAADSIALLHSRFAKFGREADTFQRVFQLSQELGVSVETTADGMTRLLVATKALGTSSKDLEDVHKNIILLGRAGGTSTEEMVGGMRQLSQGLASGRLQGEELRSVLENLPLVAIEIAKELDIDIGKIRQFAAEGKITAQVVVDALREVDVKASELPETFDMAVSRMKNEWLLFSSAVGKALTLDVIVNDVTGALTFIRREWFDDFSDLTDDQIDQAIALGEQRLIRSNRKLGRIAEQIAGGETGSNIAQAIGSIGLAIAQAPSAVAEGLEIAADEVVSAYKVAGKKWATDASEFAVPILAEQNAVVDGMVDLADRVKALRAEEEKRRAGIDYSVELDKMKIRAEAIFAKFADSSADLDEILSGPFDKLLEEFKTAETKASELRKRLEENRNELIALGPEGLAMIKAIEAEIENILISGIEEVELGELLVATKVATDEISEYAKQAARNMQDAFADWLFDPFEDGLRGMVEGFIDAMRRIAANQLAASLFDTKTGFFGKLFGRASGGPVSSGTPYMVGEQGPELFVPGASGSIIPNNKLGGGGTQVYYTIDARGADEASVISRMMPLLERTVEITKNEVRMEMREGRFA